MAFFDDFISNTSRHKNKRANICMVKTFDPTQKGLLLNLETAMRENVS